MLGYSFVLYSQCNIRCITDLWFCISQFKNRRERIKLSIFHVPRKNKACVWFNVYTMSRIDKYVETEAILVTVRGQRKGILEWLTRNMGFFFWGWWKYSEVILWWWLQNSSYTKKKKTNWIAHYKWIDFMVCALHFDKAILKGENFYVSLAPNLPTSLNLYPSILPSFP